MEVTKYCFLVVFLLHYAVFSFVSSDNTTACGPGMETPGFTYPKGDIILEYGSPLEILCILHPGQTGINASSLSFITNNASVLPQFVSIYNETTLRLFVEKPPPSQSMYYCKLHEDDGSYRGVCLNFVSIGFKPAPVQNFSCVSYNWENINCSWVPRHNDVRTRYELGFQLSKKLTRKQFQCPGKDNNNFCVWNASSTPPHRQPYEYYYFNLTASNPLGSLTVTYKINHYAVVIPHKPVNLSLVDATSSSLTITWALPVGIRSFPPGIVHKVMYQAKWDPPYYWHVVDTDDLSNKSEVLIYNITGLKYAHTLYDIRVLMRSAIAEDDNKWSEHATITLRTKATVPGQPPKTDIGSFETLMNVKEHRDVYLYWQHVPRHMENGDNFEYKIIKIQEFVDNTSIVRNITPIEVTKTFAKFKGLSYNSYKFSIVSSNKEGYSVNESHIVVPSTKQSPPEPVSFSKIAFDSGVYELSWNVASNISSYTIFWCDNKQDRPFDCKGYLNWTKVYVGKDSKQCDKMECSLLQKNVTLPADKVYQFALSANTESSSSGMVWASCTVLPDQARGKLKNLWINRIGATFIEVSWKLDCFDRSRIIRGFSICYCPIRDPQDSSCKEPFQNITIYGGPNISRGNITALKPYTTYMVHVAVISENGIGLRSDPLLNTTMEAAPVLPPVNLTAIEVTNNSISLSWEPPPSLNGVLRYYQIHWNNNITRVEDKSEVVHATLTDLRSFENYTIAVSACTVACSTNSSAIDVQTKIGRPGQMSAPQVRFVNTTEMYIKVKWNRPSYPAGLNNHYTVRLQVSDGNKIRSEQFKDVEGLSIEIPSPECRTAQYYSVSVRAVNIAVDNTTLAGPWSPQGEGNCYPLFSAPNVKMEVYILVLIVLVICIFFGCLGYRLWICCKGMQNVGVKLPPQLELNNVLKDKGKGVSDLPMTTHVCSTQLKSLDGSDVPPPDQELLLETKDKEELIESSIEDCEDGNIDRESSGCGSGHDSVSSSITTGTHITDSGTEADERPPSPESPVFSNSPRRSSDLRQRNISHSGSGGEGYSRLAPAPSGVPSAGYVSIQSAPKGYVSHAPFWAQNPSSKGYVSAAPIASSNSKATMYSKVGLKPGLTKSKDSNFSSSSRDHITDPENGISDDNQFTINPTSSI